MLLTILQGTGGAPTKNYCPQCLLCAHRPFQGGTVFTAEGVSAPELGAYSGEFYTLV